MIRRLTLTNFKAFQDAQFGFSNLNLLTGINGVGKSSVLQALLLLRQSMIKSQSQLNGLYLTGELIEIGRGADAQNIQADSDLISFEIIFDTNQDLLNAQFKYQADSDFQPYLSGESIGNVEKQPLFTKGHFQYLHANRISPSNIFKASVNEVAQYRNLGKEGEYAVHFLAHYQFDDVVLPSVCLPAQSNILLDQVNAWFNCISAGTRLRSTYRTDLNLATLAYQFVVGKGLTKEFSPVNVGFGLTYVLPVVVAILAARPGDLLLIENPESHLHPAGQAQLGNLMARAAADGVQIIVESHSDHLLNGIRVAVKESIVQADQISIYFFERDPDSEEHITEIVQPRIDENGRLSRQPKGFFDEYAHQLDRLLQ